MPRRARASKRVGHVDHVADRAGHLALPPIFNRPLCIQYPDERLAGGRLRLGQLVLVVREQQVHPAAVDVERLAEVLDAHAPSTRCASPAGPGPTGLSHAGSPGLAPFQRAKSAGFRFFVARPRSARRPPCSGSRCTACRSPRPCSRRTRRRRRPRRRNPSRSALASSMMSAMCSVALGKWSIPVDAELLEASK